MIWGRGAEGLRNSLAELKGRAQGDGAAGWDMTAKERMKKILPYHKIFLFATGSLHMPYLTLKGLLLCSLS